MFLESAAVGTETDQKKVAIKREFLVALGFHSAGILTEGGCNPVIYIVGGRGTPFMGYIGPFIYLVWK